MSVSVLHFINPFQTTDPKEQRVHEITFESIQRALSTGTGDLQVTLGIVEQEGNSHGAIKDMTALPVLKRSVLDLGDFPGAKPYPLITDIIEAARSFEADFYVFTNMDIALKSDFYQFISDLLVYEKHDGLIINRRRIPESLMNSTIEEMYREKGKPHPGFDCFVFSRSILDRMVLGNICVGIPFVGVAMAHNIFAFANNPKLFDKEHLTFHLGMEIFPPRHKQLYWHNRKIFFGKVAPALWTEFKLKNFPYADRPMFSRLFLWAKNPSLFTLFYLRLVFRELRGR